MRTRPLWSVLTLDPPTWQMAPVRRTNPSTMKLSVQAEPRLDLTLPLPTPFTAPSTPTESISVQKRAAA